MRKSQPARSLTLWLSGARIRTLPLAIGPVLLGSASAWNADVFEPFAASLALLVAISLQIGVNYANDYSDGVRGTDNHRVGPVRLTGSGLVRPELVKRVALTFFLISILAGVAVIVVSRAWWLAPIGILAIVAAWSYTGGTRPYGYRGFGELVVFMFFGPVATGGAAYVQAGYITRESIIAGVAMGFFAAAVLLVNNLRDVAQDEKAGKRTLSVHIGADASKVLITVFLLVPYGLLVAFTEEFPSSILVAATGAFAVFALLRVWREPSPSALISALQITSVTSLAYAMSLSAAIVL